MNDIEHDQLLRELAQKAYNGIMAQRAEVLAAFVAKYGCGPDEVVQVERHTGTGTRWWVERRTND